MKVLFVMRHSGYVRNFESTLRLLCERGHHVHLAFQIGTHGLLDPGDVSQELCDTYKHFTRGSLPRREDTFGRAAQELRVGLDYLRYLTPRYAQATKLRDRATRDVPEMLLRQTQSGFFSTRWGRALVTRWLKAQHRAVPTDPRIDAYLQVHKPDLLVVTPLVQPGAPQAEYLRSARALGIRTVLCVASWDNLTNKGMIHGPVDLVTVWNEMMKDEAVTLHGVPADRVTVTGAQPFDHWFDWRPSSSREAFCAKVGLPADRSYVLYLCSSKFIAPEEAPHVREWLRHMRSGSEALRHAGVLIRPHPQNAEQWEEPRLDGLGPVVVWPPAGAPPVDDRSRADYFDSIYHSAAVVGVNTTAEIESAIVGRRVHTVLAPEFRDTQDGTLHFEHLRRVEGGLLQLADTMPGHLAQLEQSLFEGGADDGRSRRFVEAFVRPYGVNVAATPKVVEALERLAEQPAPPPERLPVWAPVAWPGLLKRGAALARRTGIDVETKAWRQSRRKRRPGPTATASAPHPPPPPAAAGPAWKPLAAAFRALVLPDRIRFGLATADCMPGEVVLERSKPELLDYPNASIYLRVTTKAERKRLRACLKEPFTVAWLEGRVQPHDVLYDIGANVGAYSLVAVKKPAGPSRVVAFEPAHANVAALSANVALNDSSSHVTVMPMALSRETGVGSLQLSAAEPGSARHALASADAPTLSGEVQTTLTYRLDDAVAQFGLPAPNHIKLDVDGCELAVLEGAACTLASPALRSMLVEIDAARSDELVRLLAMHGLHLESKYDVTSTDGQQLVWYGLFARAPGSEPGADPGLAS
jgi:FkbM family methyltransferase